MRSIHKGETAIVRNDAGGAVTTRQCERCAQTRRLCRMVGQVVTVVSATVGPSREDERAAAYQADLEGDVPDGLLANALLRGDDSGAATCCRW